MQREREALGLRLRQIRTDANLSGRALAAQLGCSQAKVSKLETGAQTPTRADLEKWCTTLNRSAELPELLRRLTALETLYAEYEHTLKAGMDSVQSSIADLEQRAHTIRAFDAALIPGLLQTPDYARARITEGAAFFGIDVGDVDAAVAERMRRQAILYDSKKRFHFVITEATVTYRTAAPDVMAAQIDRLISASAGRNVRLGVIPFDARPGYAPIHGFWVHDDRLVRIETMGAQITLTQADEIRLYRKAFDRLATSALHGGEARRFLTRLAERLASNGH